LNESEKTVLTNQIKCRVAMFKVDQKQRLPKKKFLLDYYNRIKLLTFQQKIYREIE